MSTLIHDHLSKISTLEGIEGESALRIILSVYGIKTMQEAIGYKLPSGNSPELLLKSANPDLNNISPYYEIMRLQVLFESHFESIHAGLSEHPVMPMLYGYDSFEDLKSTLVGFTVPDISDLGKKRLYESVMSTVHPIDIFTGGPLFIYADEDRLSKVLDTLEKIGSPYRGAHIKHETGRIYSFFNIDFPLRAPDTWIITPTKSKAHTAREAQLLHPISQTAAFALGDGQNLSTDNIQVMHALKMSKTYSYSI